MKLLLYCTKNKWRLFFDKVKQVFTLGKVKSNNDLNGKIVGECDFEVEDIEYITEFNPRAFAQDEWFVCKNNYDVNLLKESCLSITDLCKYFKNTLEDDTCGYAIHIKNLHIFDKPRESSEYYTRIKYKDIMNNSKCTDVIFPAVKTRENLYERVYDCVYCKKLEKAPQNMQKIVLFNKETNEYEYAILISIQSQWMCKILNGEKTIEVRKKVLKEMLNNE